MCLNRVNFENIVLFFDHNYFGLSRRDSLIVNYKHQFAVLLSETDMNETK